MDLFLLLLQSKAWVSVGSLSQTGHQLMKLRVDTMTNMTIVVIHPSVEATITIDTETRGLDPGTLKQHLIHEISTANAGINSYHNEDRRHIRQRDHRERSPVRYDSHSYRPR